MALKKTVSFIFAFITFLLVTSSCSTLDVYHTTGNRVGHGPPAHAQAHGYRRKQVAGVELVYDSALGLYVVVGYPDHYYHNGYFYRLHGAVWEMSLEFNDGWVCASGKSLPPGLLTKGKMKHKKAS